MAKQPSSAGAQSESAKVTGQYIQRFLQRIEKTVTETQAQLVAHIADDSLTKKDDAQDGEDKYLHSLNDVNDRIAAIHAEMNGKIDQLQRKIDFLSTWLREYYTQSELPPGAFRMRYLDHATEKRFLAGYVALTYFARNPPIRCFVQASSTALHLGYTLAGSSSIRPGAFIKTNSVVMPLCSLYANSNGNYRVWSFCGHSFDPNCGGWLIPLDDTVSFDSLRSWFERTDKGRLSTVFLSPWYVTPNHGIYYERHESAAFADTLGAADEVVILAPGHRVVESEASFGEERNYHPALQSIWSTEPQKITVIASQPSEPLPERVSHFEEQGIRVVWQHETGWHGVEEADAAKLIQGP